jgi:cytochrome b561
MTSRLFDTTDRNEPQFQFDRGLRWLHWTMAALIFVAIGLGVASAYLPVGQQPRKGLLEIHKSLGFTILALMPITGYLFSAAGGYSLPWFGLLQWPRLLPHDSSIANWGEVLHDRDAWVIAGVLLLHLAAVGWHRWIKRDDVLSRMTG